MFNQSSEEVSMKRYLMSFPSVCSHFSQCGHSLCPEEVSVQLSANYNSTASVHSRHQLHHSNCTTFMTNTFERKTVYICHSSALCLCLDGDSGEKGSAPVCNLPGADSQADQQCCVRDMRWAMQPQWSGEVWSFNLKEYPTYYLAWLILPNSISKCNHTSQSLASVDLAGNSGQTWWVQNPGVSLWGVVSLIPWEKYDKTCGLNSCNVSVKNMFVFEQVIQSLFSWLLLSNVSLFLSSFFSVSLHPLGILLAAAQALCRDHQRCSA